MEFLWEYRGTEREVSRSGQQDGGERRSGVFNYSVKDEQPPEED
jgi:hypothetical protein